jgi:chorismate mutase
MKRNSCSVRNFVLLSAFLLFAVGLGAAGTASASTSVSGTPATAGHEFGELGPLVDLVAQRLETADTVASAKFGTTSPIEHHAREKVVLDTAATLATQHQLDPDATRTVFSDQIQGGKAVQYGIFSRWTAHPDEAPTTRADLNEVRPVLDGITTGLVRELAATQEVRSGADCGSQLRSVGHRAGRAHHFDALHADAFDRALVSVCS